MAQIRRTPLLLLLLLAAVLAGLAVEPARAGCCLVLSVDELPRHVMAGESVTISYTARLVNGQGQVSYPAQETITAVHVETKAQLVVEAVPVEGEPGRFQATLVFPEAGQWQWQLGNRPMAPLMVQAAPAQAAPATESRPPLALLPGTATAVGILGLLAAALFLWLRQRTLYRLAFLLLAAVVAIGSFVWQMAPGPVLAERETAVPAIAPEEMGEALFVAKGCVTCHRHDGITIMESVAQIGPDLTHYQGNPDFLRQWLSDPKAIRPETFMPNLDLSDAEIETLAAFLSRAADE